MAGAAEVRAFECTCPAGTPKSAPVTVKMTMPVRSVLAVRVRIPPGPNGLMGFAIGSTGTSVIPINDNEFIVAADEIFDWQLADQIDSGSWEAIMYNTGIFDHTIYVTFTVILPDQPGADATVQPVAITPPTSVPSVAPVTVDPTLPPPPELT